MGTEEESISSRSRSWSVEFSTDGANWEALGLAEQRKSLTFDVEVEIPRPQQPTPPEIPSNRLKRWWWRNFRGGRKFIAAYWEAWEKWHRAAKRWDEGERTGLSRLHIPNARVEQIGDGQYDITAFPTPEKEE